MAWVVALLLALTATTPGPAQARTLVSYERAGGFTGDTETVTVTTGGKVSTGGTRLASSTRTLGPRRLRALRRAVRAARFGSLAPAYEAEVQVSDGYTERVSHGGRTVVVEQGAPTPGRLRRLLDRLAALLR